MLAVSSGCPVGHPSPQPARSLHIFWVRPQRLARRPLRISQINARSRGVASQDRVSASTADDAFRIVLDASLGISVRSVAF